MKNSHLKKITKQFFKYMHQQIKLGEYETQLSQYDYTIKCNVHFMKSKYTTIHQLIVMSK